MVRATHPVVERNSGQIVVAVVDDDDGSSLSLDGGDGTFWSMLVVVVGTTGSRKVDSESFVVAVVVVVHAWIHSSLEIKGCPFPSWCCCCGCIVGNGCWRNKGRMEM